MQGGERDADEPDSQAESEDFRSKKSLVACAPASGQAPSHTRESEATRMQIVPVRRGVSPSLRTLFFAAVLALCCTATAVAAFGASRPQLGGRWSGRYSGVVSGSFTLTW